MSEPHYDYSDMPKPKPTNEELVAFFQSACVDWAKANEPFWAERFKQVADALEVAEQRITARRAAK